MISGSSPGSLPRGRFAPTPTGPLHFGSLVAALASCLDIRARGGEWLLRIDDLDQARERPGARETIVEDLAALGFVWDGDIATQRDRGTRYREAVDQLLMQRNAFPCACSRREIAESDREGLYPGTCRDGIPVGKTAHSVRLCTPDENLNFTDGWAGVILQNLAREVGDFILWRGDGIASYHLTTVLDDADAGITHVVRGADLIASTPRQIYLQRLLGLPTPAYAHVPLVSKRGRKLGKQTGAPRLDTRQPARTLCAALEFLRQDPPPALPDATTKDVWDWALAHWHWRPQVLRVQG